MIAPGHAGVTAEPFPVGIRLRRLLSLVNRKASLRGGNGLSPVLKPVRNCESPRIKLSLLKFLLFWRFPTRRLEVF